MRRPNRIQLLSFALFTLHHGIDGSALAGVFEAPLVADTFVDQASPDAYRGSWTTLRVGRMGSNQCHGYFLFDLDALPRGSRIRSATFSLTKLSGTGAFPRAVDLHHLYSSYWDESAITWNSQHCGTGFDNSYFCNLVASASAQVHQDDHCPYAWDVTALLTRVQARLDHFQRFVCFAVRDPGVAENSMIIFASKEGGAGARLTVEFEDADRRPEDDPFDTPRREENPDGRPGEETVLDLALLSIDRTAGYLSRTLFVPEADGACIPIRHDGGRRWTFIRVVQSHALETFLWSYLLAGRDSHSGRIDAVAKWIMAHQAEQGYFRYEMGVADTDPPNNLLTSVSVAEKLLLLGSTTGHPGARESAERALAYHLERTWAGGYFRDFPGHNNPRINFNAYAAGAFAFAARTTGSRRYAETADAVLRWLANRQFANGAWPLRSNGIAPQTDYYHWTTTKGIARAIHYLMQSGTYSAPPPWADRMLQRALDHIVANNLEGANGGYFYNRNDPPATRGRSINMATVAPLWYSSAAIYKKSSYEDFARVQMRYIVRSAPGRQNRNGSWNGGDITVGGGTVSWLYTPYTSGFIGDILEAAWFDLGRDGLLAGLIGWTSGMDGETAAMVGAGADSARDRVSIEIAPNPLASHGRVLYSLPAPGEVRLEIYDSAGRCVAHLLESRRDAGRHHLSWDGRAASGRPLAPGVYHALLRSGEHSLARKFSVVR